MLKDWHTIFIYIGNSVFTEMTSRINQTTFKKQYNIYIYYMIDIQLCIYSVTCTSEINKWFCANHQCVFPRDHRAHHHHHQQHQLQLHSHYIHVYFQLYHCHVYLVVYIMLFIQANSSRSS